MHILIAEDYEDTRMILTMALEASGYQVTCANNGREALTRARENTPDLIISDILMPEMDGFDLCRAVKTDAALRHIPFIFYTATYLDEADRELAMAAGASRFIIKPMDSLEFLDNVREVLDEYYEQRMAVPEAPLKDKDELELMHERALSRKLDEKVWQLERQRRELAMTQIKYRKLSSAIEQAGESIVITDKEGIIEYVNPAFTMLTGYSAEEAVGQTPRLLKSGNQDADFYKDMWDVITRGEVWHGKVIDRKRDGSFYPTTLTISPIFDLSGDGTTCTHFVGIQSDLTRLEDMEQRFHQAQKMEALGTLVGGIAHDFNNMLASMTGNLYLAKQRVRELPDVVQKLDNIESIAFRAADMIQQLLTFARKDRVCMKQLLLTPFVKETLKLLHTSVPENITVEQNICSESLQIVGDATELHQILMNLVSNARDALEGVNDPVISIRLEAFHTDDEFIQTHEYFTVGPYAHLSVGDNGIGIPAHQIELLFEPFFTTKEQGKGTGLGLSMVFGAIKTHHGFIEVESTEGEGSTFHLYIPLQQGKEIAADSIQQGELTKGHGELILLADDEPQIISTGKEVLESLGYRVLTAVNGQQAIDLFEAHAGEINLCIFDVIMPVMGGDKAAQAIRRIQPDIKIIFSTGYDRNIQLGMENETVLSKPFSIIEITHQIRQQLDG